MTSTRELLEKGIVFRTQSKKVSAIEAVVNTFIGLLLAYFFTWLINTVYHMGLSHLQIWNMVSWMTLLSVVRGYCIRRMFNTEFWRRWMWGKPRNYENPINPTSAFVKK